MTKTLHDVQLRVNLPVIDAILHQLALADFLGRIDMTLFLGGDLQHGGKSALAGRSNDVVLLAAVPAVLVLMS